MESITLSALPFPLRWAPAPERWHVAPGGALSITAGPRTDLFVDPQGAEPALNAPRLVGRPAGDFQLSARVTVDHVATYDAGVLVLHAHDRAWAKLCLERSPRGEAMIVSVVTRGVSDDANGLTVDGGTVWLRVARNGPAIAFHASTDGEYWQLVRHFALDPADALDVGFEAQSPTGDGCTAVFDAIAYRPESLADLRSGV